MNGDGAGIAKGSDSAKYAAAFPGLSAGMGCQTTCTGYELTADLDFDTTGNDDVSRRALRQLDAHRNLHVHL